MRKARRTAADRGSWRRNHGRTPVRTAGTASPPSRSEAHHRGAAGGGRRAPNGGTSCRVVRTSGRWSSWPRPGSGGRAGAGAPQALDDQPLRGRTVLVARRDELLDVAVPDRFDDPLVGVVDLEGR